MEEITFVDWFAGIGGFRLGLEKANQEIGEATLPEDDIQPDRCDKPNDKGRTRRHSPHFRCVGSCEIDRYARRIYEKNFGHEPEWADSTAVDVGLLPDFDLLCAGFPCQSFSVAGKRGGFTDIRGTLFFELCRILRAKRPPYFLFENVKGLLSVPYTRGIEEWEEYEIDKETGEPTPEGTKKHKPVAGTKGWVFLTILDTLRELDYDIQGQVLNSKNFGVPQNRERIFLIGHLRGQCRPEVLPIGEVDTGINETQREAQGNGSRIRVANTLSARYYKDGSENLIQAGVVPMFDGRKGRSCLKAGRVPEIGIERKAYLGGDGRVHQPNEVCQALEAGTSGGGGTSNRPIIAMTAYTKGNRTESRIQESETYPCLDGSQAYAVGQKEAYPCLTPSREKRQQGRRFKEKNDPMFSLTGQDVHGILEVAPTIRAEHHNTANVHFVPDTSYRLRRLTPVECERLQGFPDFWTATDANGIRISDGQRYRMCGNAVTVNVITAIGLNLARGIADARTK